MVYKIVWTLKALQTYESNMLYLEAAWSEKEIKKFALLVEKKLSLLSKQPLIGTARNKKQQNIRIPFCIKEFLLFTGLITDVKKLNYWFSGIIFKTRQD